MLLGITTYLTIAFCYDDHLGSMITWFSDCFTFLSWATHPALHSFGNCCYKTKNKMKPTNPNADTYVDKQRQYLFVTFPANSLVRHPEFTHWGDTLVGHPCLTLLRNALVRHSCLTPLWDTLTWHSWKTLFLDTLIWHSYLTLLWDTLTWHSCKTLLTWHSCKTLLLDTLVRHS